MARTRMITIRVDEVEHALFKGAAAAVPVSISEYARDAMLARMALEEAPSASWVAGNLETARVVAEIETVEAARMIESPADVPAAVDRAARSANPAPRPFTPYSKEQQTGKVRSSKPVGKPETCRHGLLRCKVCGTG